MSWIKQYLKQHAQCNNNKKYWVTLHVYISPFSIITLELGFCVTLQPHFLWSFRLTIFHEVWLEKGFSVWTIQLHNKFPKLQLRYHKQQTPGDCCGALLSFQ